MIEHYFECPHCWQNQLKIIDPSVREQSFIEDCEVCCNPIELTPEFNSNELIVFESNSIEQ